MMHTGWVAVPCSLASDPRLHRLGSDQRKDAVCALLAAYAYTSMYETDGFVPSFVVTIDASANLLDKLIAADFLSATVGGYLLTDFLAINSSHKQRERARDRRRKRVEEWRKRLKLGKNPRDTVSPSVSTPVPNPTENAPGNNGTQAQAQAEVLHSVLCPGSPGVAGAPLALGQSVPATDPPPTDARPPLADVVTHFDRVVRTPDNPAASAPSPAPRRSPVRTVFKNGAFVTVTDDPPNPAPAVAPPDAQDQRGRSG